MIILYIEPGKRPREIDIEHTLAKMQNLVGGYIQATYPFDDPVALVCDDDGKLKSDTEWNRTIGDYDIIKGPFFICGIGNEEFTDLAPELIEKYKKMFWDIQHFIPTPMGLIAYSE